MADARKGFRITPQAVLGLLIIVMGMLLTADNLGLADTEQFIWRYWPTILIAVGLAKIFQGRGSSGRVFGGILALVGSAMVAERVFDLPIDVGDWWPMILVFLGIVIISRARGLRGRAAQALPGQPGEPDLATLGAPAHTAATLSNEATVSEFAMWAGKQRRLSSTAFRHADLTAIMGGIELDLRQAATANGEAVVDLFVIWGGVEIWVPPDWAVSNQVGLLMGGAEDKSSGTQDAKHRLIVRGFVLMGGVEIKT
jgi:predicted membrane protein